MKKSIRILLVMLIALSVSGAVKSQGKQDLTVKLSDPSKAGQLNADLFVGSVKIIGYAGKEVIITPVGKYDPDKLTVSQKNNVVSLIVDKPNEMSLVIKVPHNFSVVVKIQASGDIDVENVNGNHDVSSVSGKITMTGIEGSVSANTKNGNIKVNVNAIKMDNPLALSNVMGSIELTLPERQKANVKLQTEFAKAFSEFAIDQKPSESKLVNMGNKMLTGKINGGGSMIMLKSIGGNVYLKKNR